MVVDPAPSPAALEGNDPQSGKWPPPASLTPPAERQPRDRERGADRVHGAVAGLDRREAQQRTRHREADVELDRWFHFRQQR